MKKSQLKKEIKENIYSLLSEDEDYEQAPREVEHGISPEPMDAEEDLMGELDESNNEIDAEQDLMGELDKPINEAEDDEGDENIEGEDQEEQSDEDLQDKEGSEPKPPEEFSSEEQTIQDSLKSAYDSAVNIQDEKLIDQIGNTITMFTRTRVLNR